MELDESLKAGAAGEIGMESTTKIAVRLLPTTAHSRRRLTPVLLAAGSQGLVKARLGTW